MARAAEIELSIDDFQMISDKTPFLADLMYVQGFLSPFFVVDVLQGPRGGTTWKTSIKLVESQQY